MLNSPQVIGTESTIFDCVLCFFVRNHPSVDPEPSEDDMKLVRRLMEAGEIIGIEVLDHIIIGDGEYLSIKASNLF